MFPADCGRSNTKGIGTYPAGCKFIYGEVMARLSKLGGTLPSLKSNHRVLAKPEPSYGQGRGGRPWRRLKREVHERDNWTCCSCGRVTMNLECDHITNKAQGGTDDMSNLQSLCKPCHNEKSQQESKQGMQGS